MTKLSPDKKWIKLDTLVPTLIIIIFNTKNKIVWIMMYSKLSLYSFQALEKLDLEVLVFGYLHN